MQDNSRSSIEKIIIKISSLIVAIALWLFISYTLNPEMIREFSDVPIEYKMPKVQELVIMGDYIKTTDVKISGKRNDLIALSKDDIRAYVDLKYATSYDDEFRVDIELPSRKKFSLISVEQSSVKLDLDDLIRKDFELGIRITEQNNDKNRWLECKTIPQRIQVNGPRREIDKIQSIYVEYNARDVLNADSASDDFVRKLKISSTPIVELKNNEGEKINEDYMKYSHESVSLLCDIMEEREVNLVFNKIHLGSDHLKVISQKTSTDTVNILGLSKDLAEVDKIYCTPVIPTAIDKAGLYRLPVKYDLSEGLKVLNARDVYLDIEVVDVDLEKDEDEERDEDDEE